MKAQLLKISGHKNLKDFYKEFPDEASFKARYGKELKKAQFGYNIAEGFTDSGMQRATGSLGQYNSNPYSRQTLTPASSITPAGFTNSSMQNATGTLGQNVGKLPIDLGNKSQLPGIGQVTGAIEGIAGAASAFKQQNKAKKEAYQNRAVTDLQLKASATRPEDIQRKYARAEDIQNTGEEFFPIHGVGSNPIDSAKNGKRIKAQNGFSDFMGAGGTEFATKAVGKAFGNNAGSQMGSAVGNVVKMIPGVGPVVGAVAAPVLSAIGGTLDQAFGDAGKIKRAQAATNRNIAGIQGNAMGQGVQQQYASYMEDGGEFPQYRAGGNLREYTPPSEQAMQTYAMGGELQSPDGGLDTISQNPYLPEGGETVMLRGASHDDGGMPISYAGNMVEAEGGEPIVQLNDGNETNAVIFGNLKINKEAAQMLGDKNATNKKFKNYVNDLSKKEERSNKLNTKSGEELGELDVITSFDKLKESSLKANMLGSNMTLKSIADKKEKAAQLQSSINDTAEEFGLDADALAQGKYKKGKFAGGAKYGRELFKVQEGTYLTKGILPGSINYNTPEVAGGQFSGTNYDTVWGKKRDTAFSNPEVTKQIISALENYTGDDANDVKAALAKEKTMSGKIQRAYELASDRMVGPYHNILNTLIDKTAPAPTVTDTTTLAPVVSIDKPIQGTIQANEPNPYMTAFNSLLPWLRTDDTEELDPRQLTGEMFALSSNQLEPVSAQSYQPQLDVPYDISLQDIRNENQADYRAAQRMAGYNPAAQAALNAQKYAANQKVGAEEFRMNQAMKDRVYSGNRATMNDARLKNLAIYDQQYGRQAQAKSNTKAITQAALNSIADKYAKNRLENRTLQTYENLYNYRYDNNYRAINENPLAQFNTALKQSNIGQGNTIPEGYEYIYNKEGKPIDIKKSSKEKSRNGSIVKALKKI